MLLSPVEQHMITSLLIFLSDLRRYREFALLGNADMKAMSNVQKSLSVHHIYSSSSPEHCSNLVLFYVPWEDVINKISLQPQPVSLIWLTNSLFVPSQVIPNNITFLLMSKNRLVQLSKPSRNVTLQSATVAEFVPAESKWVSTNAKISLLYTSISMANETLTLSYTNKLHLKTLLAGFNAGGILSILQRHFNFRLFLIQKEDRDFSGVDIVGTLYLINGERLKQMSFITIGWRFWYQFIIRRPNDGYLLGAMANIMRVGVWLTLYIFATLIIFTLYLSKHWSTRGRLSFAQNLAYSSFTILRLLYQQAIPHPIKTIHERIIVFAALILFFVFYQAYVSQIWAVISARKAVIPFQTMREFIDTATYDLIISKTTAVYAAFETAKSGEMKEIYEKFIKDHPENDADLETAPAKLCRGSSTLFALALQTSRFLIECPLIILPESYHPIQFGLACQKDFRFHKNFNLLFFQAIEGGLSQRVKRLSTSADFFGQPASLVTHEDFGPVQIDQVLLVFFLFGVISCISIIFFIIEKCVCPVFRKPRL